jgi:pimeloyl-ACP methyl ester carboxylesterase
VSQGSTTPGAPVTAASWGSGIALFLADRGGGIYTAAGDPQAGFGPWSSVSQFPPAPISYQLGVLPPDPTPTIPDGDDIILYIHGGPGSRLEECADLVGPLHVAGANNGKRYTVIAFDQPSQGYSSMVGPDQFVPTHDQIGDHYPTVSFSEDFIVAFVDALDTTVPIKNRNIYIIGGSLGGALALRMGHRSEPWIRRVVAWSAACVWSTYANDVLKGTALHDGFGRSDNGEDDARRNEYFVQAFGKPTPLTQPNPEEWYRGDRDRYYDDLATPAATEWPCKWDYIAAARLDQQEVYNWRYRRWHWRLGTELLLFSFSNDNWEGPANTATALSDANYWTITKPTLLAAAEDDDWNVGPHLQWENRWSRTQDLAPLMKQTPGYTLFLPNTGHSIHNERPILFAEQIVAFLSDPTWDAAVGPLQVRPLFDAAAMPDEDRDCSNKPTQLSRSPRPAQELLAIPNSAARLMEPAQLGGYFSDGHSPGTYGLRLKQELRDVALQSNPAVALGTAAARYFGADPIWGAFADLAVTGRTVYEAFRNHQPTDEEIKAVARTLLTPAPDENKLGDAVLAAKTRAYKVAWVLRDPDPEEGYRLRPAWGWIAVSGEDDSPARPVNVSSGVPIMEQDGTTQVSAHPQYELTVQMPQTQFYSSVSFQIRYTIASRPTSQLLSYGDAGTPGNVSSPVVVGLAGWEVFRFLFAGRNAAGENRIYAVDQNGQLLSYGDAGTPGNVSSPVVVGLAGWEAFKCLFAGRNAAGEDRIYALDQNGQLLSYGDAGTPGNVSSPVVVGLAGWEAFKCLFAGRNVAGEDRIYAVDQNGQLLSYGDAGTPGNVSSPVVVGLAGWEAFKCLFAGPNVAGEDRIYAVDQNGQLLSYGDDGTPGNFSSPVIVGLAGWKAFMFLFAGRNAAGEDRIYAVAA